MNGVYGDFINNFPELFETMMVWEEYKKPRKIRGVYIPQSGISMLRLKGGMDITGVDAIYVSKKYNIKLGMFFKRSNGSDVQKIINIVEYEKPGGFQVFLIERVTGVNPEQTTDLRTKKPLYT